MLDIPTVLAPCILTINDISEYNFDDPMLSCPMLEITPPGFSAPIVFNNNANTNITLTWNGSYHISPIDLGLQQGNVTELCDLPDGIYIIRYSVSPNEVVYVEYNHLRITQALNSYKKTLCCVDLNKNKLGYENREMMNMLCDFRTYLDGAKALVEVCHKPAEGMALYHQAMKILDKINCNYC